MATVPGQKEALARWRQLCLTIQSMSTVNAAESKAAQMRRVERARKDYAYTMVDINSRINDEAAEDLRSIPGMIRVRILNH